MTRSDTQQGSTRAVWIRFGVFSFFYHQCWQPLAAVAMEGPGWPTLVRLHQPPKSTQYSVGKYGNGPMECLGNGSLNQTTFAPGSHKADPEAAPTP